MGSLSITKQFNEGAEFVQAYNRAQQYSYGDKVSDYFSTRLTRECPLTECKVINGKPPTKNADGTSFSMVGFNGNKWKEQVKVYQ